MACESLIAYSKECSKGISGGVAKLWLLAYKDLGVIEGTNSAYELGITGDVTQIAFNSDDVRFVPVGLLRNTVGLTETFTKTPETGSFEITTELPLTISNITSASRAFVDSLMGGEIVALIKMKSGRYIITGLDGYLEVTSVVGSTGIAGADLNGYTITLSGVETDLARVVDELIIPEITTVPTP